MKSLSIKINLNFDISDTNAIINTVNILILKPRYKQNDCLL